MLAASRWGKARRCILRWDKNERCPASRWDDNNMAYLQADIISSRVRCYRRWEEIYKTKKTKKNSLMFEGSYNTVRYRTC